MEPEGSLPHSQQHATCPYPQPELLLSHQRISPAPTPCKTSRYMVSSNGEDLLAPRPALKLENHPLSAAVKYCSFKKTLNINECTKSFLVNSTFSLNYKVQL
jgi:hypothetical protein